LWSVGALEERWRSVGALGHWRRVGALERWWSVGGTLGRWSFGGALECCSAALCAPRAGLIAGKFTRQERGANKPVKTWVDRGCEIPPGGGDLIRVKYPKSTGENTPQQRVKIPAAVVGDSASIRMYYLQQIYIRVCLIHINSKTTAEKAKINRK
jgi:hypothetical protein